VFCSLSIVILFEKKLLDYSHIQFAYRMSHAPLRSLVYTITRSSKTRSINFLLQNTGINTKEQLLTDVQNGFKSKRLCLFLTIDDFARAIDNKFQVDMAILITAFDKVAHARLARKRNYYGTV